MHSALLGPEAAPGATGVGFACRELPAIQAAAARIGAVVPDLGGNFRIQGGGRSRSPVAVPGRSRASARTGGDGHARGLAPRPHGSVPDLLK